MLSHVLALALAAGPEFLANKPPPIVPKEAAAFWAEVHRHAHREAEQMIRDVSKQLGYQRSEYTEGDLKCMALFNAWGSVESARRKNPRLCPESFTKWLEKAKNEACFDDDPPNTPGAATGRGWNTIRRAVLGRGDVQREVSPADALSWVARVGVLLPALTWSGSPAVPASPVIIVDPNRLPDVRPPDMRKTDPRDML